jgi:hypothetical protein
VFLGALACLLLAAGFGLPASAYAAPVALGTETLQVQLWPEAEPGAAVLIVGIVLPEDTQLPATVRLPVPTGASVFWVGEIVDDTLANDIERPYELVQGTGGMAVEFSVEETRSVQYEATYGSIPQGANEIDLVLEWVQSVATKDVSFGVRLPAGVQDVSIDPPAAGEPLTNAAGESLYVLPNQQLAAGGSSRVSVSYAYAGSGQGQASSRTMLTVLGVLLAAAVVALFVAIARQQSDGARASEPAHATSSAVAEKPGGPKGASPAGTDEDDETFMTWD